MRQVVVEGDDGAIVARADIAYPDARLAIEVDGYRYHTGRAAWQYDVSRSNALIARGWRVLRFAWDDVTARPGHVLAAVRRALATDVRAIRNGYRDASLEGRGPASPGPGPC